MIGRRHPLEDLSALVDGELDPAQRASVEAHVARCGVCTAIVADLRVLVRAAVTLQDRPPAHDLWPAIEARLTVRPTAERQAEVIPLAGRVRRVSFSWSQLAAAAIAMILLGGAAVWITLAGRGTVPGGRPGIVAERPADEGPAEAMLAGDLADGAYASAVADLEAALAASRHRLDPETVAVIERNIDIIDQAIADTRRALEADPQSVYLTTYLATQMRRKVDILRTATTVAQASS